jgi:hypothetical protein
MTRGDHPDDREGRCRRHAPVPLLSDFQYEVLRFLSIVAWNIATDDEKKRDFDEWEDHAHVGHACWPTTTGADWCGEYQPTVA